MLFYIWAVVTTLQCAFLSCSILAQVIVENKQVNDDDDDADGDDDITWYRISHTDFSISEIKFT